MSCHVCDSAPMTLARRPGDGRDVIIHKCGFCGRIRQHDIERVDYMQEMEKLCRESAEDTGTECNGIFCYDCWEHVDLADIQSHYGGQCGSKTLQPTPKAG